MISFRFHLLSLTAVFLALALGIVLGYTFLSEATVNRLEDQIRAVRAQAREASDGLSKWNTFGNEAEEAIVAGQLEGVRVLVVVSEGVDGGVVDDLHNALATAGAIDAGLVTIDDKWADDTPSTRADIAGALGIVGPVSSEAVTASAADRLARELGDGGGPTLGALIAANLLHLDAGDPATTPGARARVVVVSSGPPIGLSEPLARALGQAMPARVLVADASADDEFSQSLVASLRKDAGEARVSTVDHVDLSRGRIAAILALRDFGHDAIGDYGSAAGADRSAPASG